MQRCPRTGVKEVNSYLDERAPGMRAIRRYILALIDANIRLGDVILTFVVDCRPARVRQRRQTTEIRDTIQLRVEPIESDGWAWKKLVDLKRRKSRRAEHIATCDRHRRNLSPRQKSVAKGNP